MKSSFPTHKLLALTKKGARDYFKYRPSYEVVGGYLSPVTDAYQKKGLASANHRMAMCSLAVESSEWLMVDGWESAQAEYQRTVLVLDYFQSALNTHWKGDTKPQVMLLCGSDLLESFNKPGVWSDEDMEAIVGKYGIVCTERVGTDIQQVIAANDILFKNQSNIFVVPQYIPNDISSTKIRQFIPRGLSIKYLTPDPVIKYIEEHNLYK